MAYVNINVVAIWVNALQSTTPLDFLRDAVLSTTSWANMISLLIISHISSYGGSGIW